MNASFQRVCELQCVHIRVREIRDVTDELRDTKHRLSKQENRKETRSQYLGQAFAINNFGVLALAEYLQKEKARKLRVIFHFLEPLCSQTNLSRRIRIRRKGLAFAFQISNQLGNSGRVEDVFVQIHKIFIIGRRFLDITERDLGTSDTHGGNHRFAGSRAERTEEKEKKKG
jgi:hypothetical protein